MTLKYGPNLGALIAGAPGDEHYQAILSQWRALDGLVQPAVSSRVSALPTTNLVEGDRYLVTAGTNANRIARYREANTETGLAAGWEYFTPREGWVVWSVADKKGYRFSNGAWAEDAAGSSFAGGTLTTALNEAPIMSLPSAATVNIGAAAANTIQVTGTTAITGFDTIAAGARRTLRFTGALTLTYDATKLILPRGANIQTAAGDTADFISLGSGNWVCVDYQRASAAAARADLGLTLSASGARFGGVVPFVDADGILDVGKFIDFHEASGDTSDFLGRMISSSGMPLWVNASVDNVARQVFTQQNIVGGVGYVGNYPSGAVIEKGTIPGRGTYTRWADGTQVCKLVVDQNIAFDNHFGPGYYGVFNWTYPAAFAGDNPAIAFTCKPSGSLALPCLGGDPSVDQRSAVDLLPFAWVNQTMYSRIGMIAQGTWK